MYTFANNIRTRKAARTWRASDRATASSTITRASQSVQGKGQNLSGDDVREGLTAVISVKLPDPQFEGQTKAKLGNHCASLTAIVSDGLADYLEENPKPAREIIKKAQQASKARNAARKAREVTRRKSC